MARDGGVYVLNGGRVCVSFFSPSAYSLDVESRCLNAAELACCDKKPHPEVTG